MKTDISLRSALTFLVAAMLVSAVSAYLPPVDEKGGVKVEIGSFPQKIERSPGNPFRWPLGVTEVSAGAPRAFPVTLENRMDRPLAGELEVWMNDDWTVTGPQGPLALAPKERRTLSFTGTAKPRALDALYPVHARFTPKGTKKTDAAHPIAVFMYRNPDALRPVPPVTTAKLVRGAYRLDRNFVRTTSVEVRGTVHALPESGDAGVWGGGMTKRRLQVGGIVRDGFSSHPPYCRGAGVLWSDFPLDLPKEAPLAFSCFNYLCDPGKAPPSDGVEFRVYAFEAGRNPQLVCSQTVKKILTWSPLAGDLTPWAGKKITLRLWTGPGPKMDTCCDGCGWGDVTLAIGPQPKPPTEQDWRTRGAQALAAAETALVSGTDAAAKRWRLAGDGTACGAGAVYGERGLVDGVLAFTDGRRSVVYRGFTATVETADGGPAPLPQADIREEKGTLRIAWSIPGVTRDARGCPRITDLGVGPASERPFRVFAGFGNVIENPKRFTLHANGFELSTRHVGAEYANGLSVVQAVDVPPDRAECDGEKGLFSLHAHHDATFTFVPSAKGAFAAARRFRDVSGYRVSAGHAKLGARMCLDQWGGDYGRAADDLAKAAKYGLTDTIFVKHDWQRWGYDYRLPEIYPPRGDVSAFGRMRDACRAAGILFCPHDNYTDIYPDAENYSYDLTVFNLDGTPQRAWFNPGRHALSYRWAPHAFHPWLSRNAKLLKDGFDPDAIFIDVLTAHAPFDYLDREGRFHSKMETSAAWGRGFELYRKGFGRPDTVCVSEAGQDHLVGIVDAGQSDHFGAAKWLGGTKAFSAAERTPWHDIVTHGRYVLFAGGLGGRYQEEVWLKDGDADLHGYASDDYLSNTMLGGRNPMCDGPFSRRAVKTYWQQHDACAELGRAEFLDLRYEGSIFRQHALFSDGGEVWVNRATNGTWRLADGCVLPPYGYYAKTRTTESGILERDGVRYAFSKSPSAVFVDARKPFQDFLHGAISSAVRAEPVAANRVRVVVSWKTLRPLEGYQPFVHICSEDMDGNGIVFQCGMGLTQRMFGTPGTYEVPIDVIVPEKTPAGVYTVRYGAWRPDGGDRLSIGGGRNDGDRRTCGGELVVKNVDGRVTGVAWHPDREPDSMSARERLLGLNRAGRVVDFGGIRTDGSFRFADDTVTPLPHSDGFTAEIDLPAGRTVVGVQMLDPAADAAKPTWKQTGRTLTLSCDAKAFAYRLQFAKARCVTGAVFGAARPVEGSGGTAMALAVEGGRLYAGCGGSVVVYDISSPLVPKKLGEVRGFGAVRQLVVRKGMVYLSARESGLWIVDATNPAKPRIRSRFDSVELATGIDVAGDVVFIGQRQNGVEFIDVSDPDRPAHIAIRRTDESQSVKYRDGYVYSGDWGSGHVTVFDARDMRNIRQVAYEPLWGFGDGVWMKGRYLYCATGHHAKNRDYSTLTYRGVDTDELRTFGKVDAGSGCGHGLDVFDISDPAAPKRVGRVDYPPFYGRGFDMWTPRTSACSDIVFAAQTHNGIFAVDCSNPANPVVLDRWVYPSKRNPQHPSACIGSVAVGDGCVYAAGHEGCGVTVIPAKGAAKETFDPGVLPRHADFRETYPTDEKDFWVWKPETPGQARAVALQGDTVYAACGAAGLHVLTIRPAGGFAKIGALKGAKAVFDVQVQGSRLYTAEGRDGWAVYEIRGPSDFTEVVRRRAVDAKRDPALCIWKPRADLVALWTRRGNVCIYREDDVNAKRPLVQVGGCPGWNKYLMDAAIGGGRWLAFNAANSCLKWIDLAAQPKPVVRQSSAKNRISLSNGICRFSDGLAFVTRGQSYHFLAPGACDPADGSAWPAKPFPGKAMNGMPRVSAKGRVLLTNRIRREIGLWDFADRGHPKPLGRWKVSGNPDCGVFHGERFIVPCGYQGVLMQK